MIAQSIPRENALPSGLLMLGAIWLGLIVLVFAGWQAVKVLRRRSRRRR